MNRKPAEAAPLKIRTRLGTEQRFRSLNDSATSLDSCLRLRFVSRCTRNSVLFFVLFERGARPGADLVGSFDSRRRVELWVVVHDRLVGIGQAFEAHVGILRHPASGRVPHAL